MDLAKDALSEYAKKKLEELDLDSLEEDEPSLELVQRTYRPNRLKRKRTHGFLKRLSTPSAWFLLIVLLLILTLIP